MGKVCKKSWIAAIFLGVMLFATGFAFQASTVDAQAATTGFRTVKGKTYYYKNGKKVKGWLTLNGKKYFLNTRTGVLLKGWQRSSRGPKRYFNKKNGVMYTGMKKIGAKGNIVYHPQQQQLYNELQTENISLIMDTDEDTVLTGTGNDGKLYSISRSEKTGWTVVDCTNVKELLSKSRQAQSVYVLTAIILVIVALLFSRFMARSITLPIQKLRDSMKKVQEGDFSVSDVVVDSKNEIGSLTKSFDVMTHRIHELMEQNVHEQEEKRKSELKALQSQINPHFLYNTLDSIIWMAEGKKNEEVVLMTASLARLLRQSISNEDEVVPIANEVEYARGYLTIQKMRYKDKLEFQIEVDSSILYIPLIKLVLQPIIENAIYHGLKYKESKGLLIVKGFMKDGNAVLQVIDDGVGMDEETLAHIYDKHKVNYHSNGVGVYNVQKRLKLYYGEDYGITYTSELGKGTTATITIPGRQEGQI